MGPLLWIRCEDYTARALKFSTFLADHEDSRRTYKNHHPLQHALPGLYCTIVVHIPSQLGQGLFAQKIESRRLSASVTCLNHWSFKIIARVFDPSHFLIFIWFRSHKRDSG
mmetsp:Transcript_5344/g.7916  ORF Transcript_5344/g.7916 Transcript_5344/m.7916 type:complete len:111 (-) Transcript_5344:16-348(-)